MNARSISSVISPATEVSECLFFGSMNAAGSTQGIFSAQFQPSSGKLSELKHVVEALNPSWMVWHPTLPIVYSVIERRTVDGRRTGAIAIFRTNGSDGTLTPLCDIFLTHGLACHLAVHPSGRILVAANYLHSSVEAFALGDDGRVERGVDYFEYKGETGPMHARQDASHPHAVIFSVDGRFGYVADLGRDCIAIYRVLERSGCLRLVGTESISLPPGSGPRHLIFSPDGLFCYIIGELDGTVLVCKSDPENGTLTLKQRISCLPKRMLGENAPAEIQMSRDGRFVYASNRGTHNSITVFRRDAQSGRLEPIEVTASGGKSPRHFTLVGEGQWLICAHQLSDTLTVFAVDHDTGRLSLRETLIVPKGLVLILNPSREASL